MTNMGLRPSTDNPGRTYRWYDSPVLPYGHGMHYTTFQARFSRCGGGGRGAGPIKNGSQIAISSLLSACGKGTNATVAHLDLCPVGTSLPVDVTNTGNVTSDFVALAFLAGEYGPAPHPLKSLAAYGRVRGVKSGQTARAKLPALTLGTLARVDLAGNTVLYPGEYRLLLDVPTQTEIAFTLTGEPVVLDRFPQPK
jgi:beta-D-xylosidase 4